MICATICDMLIDSCYTKHYCLISVLFKELKIEKGSTSCNQKENNVSLALQSLLLLINCSCPNSMCVWKNW